MPLVQDTLRLLTLWFQHGKSEKVSMCDELFLGMEDGMRGYGIRRFGSSGVRGFGGSGVRRCGVAGLRCCGVAGLAIEFNVRPLGPLTMLDMGLLDAREV